MMFDEAEQSRRIRAARAEIEANRLELQRDFARAGWILLGLSIVIFLAGLTMLVIWP